MKKILLTLAAAFGLAIAGSGTAWADTAKTVVISAGSDFTLGCKDASVFKSSSGSAVKNQYAGNTGTDAEGFSVAITGKTDKAYSAANSITIDGTKYASIKLSNGAENTLYLPANATAQSIKFYSYVNLNVKDKGWGRTSYWQSVNGVTYTAEPADTLCCWIDSTVTVNKSTTYYYSTKDFDCREFTFSSGVTDSIKFKNTGEQVCFVAVLTYTVPDASVAGTPSATDPTFSFANKKFLVSLTPKNEGETVKYTLNGTEATYEASFSVVNGDKVAYWAEANGLVNSDTVEFTVSGLPTYDANKAFVAWAYQAGYSNVVAYTTDSDPLYKAMSEEYNVVSVAGATSDNPATLCPTLESADLLVITEAMKSNQTFSNGLTAYVGKLPVLNLKAFSYGKSAWSTWGGGSNPKSATSSIVPTDGNYKLFEGLTVENGEIVLFDGTATTNANRVQGVTLKDVFTNPVTLANVETVAAIHTADFAKGYIFIGISCDDIAYANANAQKLIKNAAAILIANGSLTATAEAAELATVSFADMDYATFVSEKPAIIPEGVTAYVGKLNETNTYLNLEEVNGFIPANTPVVLKGVKGTPATLKSTIYTIAEVENNDIQGSVSEVNVPTGKDIYTLSIADEVVAFRKYTGATLKAGKAYLAVAAGASVPMIRFSGMDTDEPGNVTGLNAVTIENNAQQVIYDLRGRRVLSIDRPGLYIVNGKKVAVK